ncbi:hypothetical protein SNEBB_006841 [Seison nebaliae]|nr:hypothetical protein SNEBB_006841 [Seison nebaliae]
MSINNDDNCVISWHSESENGQFKRKRQSERDQTMKEVENEQLLNYNENDISPMMKERKLGRFFVQSIQLDETDGGIAPENDIELEQQENDHSSVISSTTTLSCSSVDGKYCESSTSPTKSSFNYQKEDLEEGKSTSQKKKESIKEYEENLNKMREQMKTFAKMMEEQQRQLKKLEDGNENGETYVRLKRNNQTRSRNKTTRIAYNMSTDSDGSDGIISHENRIKRLRSRTHPHKTIEFKKNDDDDSKFMCDLNEGDQSKQNHNENIRQSSLNNEMGQSNRHSRQMYENNQTSSYDHYNTWNNEPQLRKEFLQEFQTNKNKLFNHSTNQSNYNNDTISIPQITSTDDNDILPKEVHFENVRQKRRRSSTVIKNEKKNEQKEKFPGSQRLFQQQFDIFRKQGLSIEQAEEKTREIFKDSQLLKKNEENGDLTIIEEEDDDNHKRIKRNNLRLLEEKKLDRKRRLNELEKNVERYDLILEIMQRKIPSKIKRSFDEEKSHYNQYMIVICSLLYGLILTMIGLSLSLFEVLTDDDLKKETNLYFIILYIISICWMLFIYVDMYIKRRQNYVSKVIIKKKSFLQRLFCYLSSNDLKPMQSKDDYKLNEDDLEDQNTGISYVCTGRICSKNCTVSVSFFKKLFYCFCCCLFRINDDSGEMEMGSFMRRIHYLLSRCLPNHFKVKEKIDETELKELSQKKSNYLNSYDVILKRESKQHGYHFDSRVEVAGLFVKYGCAAFCAATGVLIGLKLAVQLSDVTMSTAEFFENLFGLIFILTQFLFIFQKSNLIIYRARNIALFGVIHIVATNLCRWAKLLIEEASHASHNDSHSTSTHYDHGESVLSTTYQSIIENGTIFASLSSDLHHRLNKRATVVEANSQNEKFRDFFDDASPYLLPAAVEYSLLSLEVFLLIYYNIGRKLFFSLEEDYPTLTIDENDIAYAEIKKGIRLNNEKFMKKSNTNVQNTNHNLHLLHTQNEQLEKTGENENDEKLNFHSNALALNHQPSQISIDAKFEMTRFSHRYADGHHHQHNGGSGAYDLRGESSAAFSNRQLSIFNDKSPDDQQFQSFWKKSSVYTIDCHKSTRGLFIGLIVLLGTIISMIVGYVYKREFDHIPSETYTIILEYLTNVHYENTFIEFCITYGTQTTLILIALICTIWAYTVHYKHLTFIHVVDVDTQALQSTYDTYTNLFVHLLKRYLDTANIVLRRTKRKERNRARQMRHDERKRKQSLSIIEENGDRFKFNNTDDDNDNDNDNDAYKDNIDYTSNMMHQERLNNYHHRANGYKSDREKSMIHIPNLIHMNSKTVEIPSTVIHGLTDYFSSAVDMQNILRKKNEPSADMLTLMENTHKFMNNKRENKLHMISDPISFTSITNTGNEKMDSLKKDNEHKENGRAKFSIEPMHQSEIEYSEPHRDHQNRQENDINYYNELLKNQHNSHSTSITHYLHALQRSMGKMDGRKLPFVPSILDNQKFLEKNYDTDKLRKKLQHYDKVLIEHMRTNPEDLFSEKTNPNFNQFINHQKPLVKQTEYRRALRRFLKEMKMELPKELFSESSTDSMSSMSSTTSISTISSFSSSPSEEEDLLKQAQDELDDNNKREQHQRPIDRQLDIEHLNKKLSHFNQKWKHRAKHIQNVLADNEIEKQKHFMHRLDIVLTFVSLFGLLIYESCSFIASVRRDNGKLRVIYGTNYTNYVDDYRENMFHAEVALSIILSIISIIQSILQTLFIIDGLNRAATDWYALSVKPGRESATLLIIINLLLWFYGSFKSQTNLSTPLQVIYFGKSSWNLIKSITLPLSLFFRFHSSCALTEIWKRAHHRPDHPRHQHTHQNISNHHHHHHHHNDHGHHHHNHHHHGHHHHNHHHHHHQRPSSK